MGSFCRKYCCCLKPCFPCLFSGGNSEQEDKGGQVFANPAVVKPNLQAEQKDLEKSKIRAKPLPSLPGQDLIDICSFVALFDYNARTEEDLSFRAGDKLKVLNASKEGWWYAKLLLPEGSVCPGRKLMGYIPANYIAVENSIEAELWFFGATKRADAEEQLLHPENQEGTFLIRESESVKDGYSLSVFDGTSVKHYRIKKMDGRFYLIKTKTFETVQELVDCYSKNKGGLCTLLRKPCPKKQAPATYDLTYETVDHWQIDRKSLKLLRKLGSGQFGDVWEGLWNDTIPVAIKTLKPGCSMNREDFLGEAQTMKNLRHQNILQLYAVCTLEDPIYIITELMKYGSLLQYLRDGGSKITLADQVDMAAQVASGMAYLESQKYIHRDLAARNVLVGEHKVYKVADFGLARVLQVENGNRYKSLTVTKLPVKWTAPEAIYGTFSSKSDVWSFGILLFEITTYGEMPYQGMAQYEVIQKLDEGYRLPQPERCPAPLYEMMLECWRAEADQRPTFEVLSKQLEGFL
ncbi:FRK kinase, partial [Bombycilla garrulus]|nr:FRK kinase [Bombycilla garrulus]